MNEPMLVSAMRRRGSGEVRYTPESGPKSGTSAQTFLAEFDEYVESLKGDFVSLSADQVECVKALLSLIHYDDLATYWLYHLPEEVRPGKEQ